jgi:hypothetical protein
MELIPRKSFFKILILMFTLLSQIILTANISDPECKTPFDCVIKALELVKRDREDMYRIRDQMSSLIVEVNKKMDEKISQIKSDLETKFFQLTQNFTAKLEEYKKTIDTDFNEIKSEFDIFKTSVENKNHMYREADIYDNIIDALEKNIVQKSGNPTNWDELSYRKNPWNGKLMINIGTTQQNGNGLKVTIPEHRDVLWLRVHNDDHQWNQFRLMYLDGDKETIPKYAAGQRKLNEISPDGGASDSFDRFHAWVPIPVPRSGSLVVHADCNNSHWISGVAFGNNLWGHAKNSGLAYHWAINGGTKINFHSENWNNDILVYIPAGSVSQLFVPIVNNGNDKLLYIVEHNNNWNGIMHTKVTVNGVLIERFRASYINPFAMHINSKIYNRYIAAKVPKDLIKPGDNMLNVMIDMTNQNNHIHLREIGTHDLF